jgi:hypothetical protein
MAYRSGWSRRPYYVPMFIVGIVLIGFGVAGTAMRDPAAICFVPGVLVLFLHHFLVVRAAAR